MIPIIPQNLYDGFAPLPVLHVAVLVLRSPPPALRTDALASVALEGAVPVTVYQPFEKDMRRGFLQGHR